MIRLTGISKSRSNLCVIKLIFKDYYKSKSFFLLHNNLLKWNTISGSKILTGKEENLLIIPIINRMA